MLLRIIKKELKLSILSLDPAGDQNPNQNKNNIAS